MKVSALPESGIRRPLRGDGAGFSESAEFRQFVAREILVTMAYAAMLKRTPEFAGFAFWVEALERGESRLARLSGFSFSSEYRRRFLP